MATPGAASEGPVVLINMFEVTPEQEEEFLVHWKEAREHLEKQEGYISTKLHKSLKPEATYRYINVAQWQSAQHWEAAVGSDAFQPIAQRARERTKGTRPFLYRVIAE